jgi:beta-galactosidase
MYVPQYPSAAWLRSIGERGADRPVVPSEYAHAMGNSTGDLYNQWQAIYDHPQLQGGYIWEWIDHSTLAHDKNGKPFWTYGGDFGGEWTPSDGNFVADGLVGPDQMPHPAMSEVKYTHQNVGFRAVDLAAGKVEITNRFYFTSLADYEVRYEVRRGWTALRKGVLPLGDLAPQTSRVVAIPVEGLKAGPGDEFFVNFTAVSKKAAPLVPAGHVVAYDQFQLPLTAERIAPKPVRVAPLEVVDKGDAITVSSPVVSFTFDRAAGVATSYKVRGIEYFDKEFGIRPNFWRAPNDNDYGNGAPARLQIWKTVSNNPAVESATVEREGDRVKVAVKYAWDLTADGVGMVACYVDYTVWPSGELNVDMRYDPRTAAEVDAARLNARTHDGEVATYSPQTEEERRAQRRVLEIPRIGVRFRLPATMDNVTYFGRGPEENYIDRWHGTTVGLYSTTAWEMYTPYVRPQENGHRTQVRWMSLSESGGRGLMVVSDDGALEFNALRNSVEDFDSEEARDKPYQWPNLTPEQKKRHDEAAAANVRRRQTHAADITPRDFVEVCLDGRHQGVAGYNSWGDRPQPYATIPSDQEFAWSCTLVPVASGKEALQKSKLGY